MEVIHIAEPTNQTGLFEIDGLAWVHHGHIARTNSLATARRTAEELIELGYIPTTASHPTTGVYEFKYDLPGGFHGRGYYEIVTIQYLSNSLADAARWHVVYVLDGEMPYVRFGDKTFVDKEQIGSYYHRAVEKHGRGNVVMEPTLFW